MLAEQGQQLISFKEMSEQMLVFAKQENWFEVEVLEQQRVELMKQLFSHQFTESDTPIIAPVIELVISINQEITIILEKNKKNLQIEFSQFNSSKRAENAYLKNMG